MSNISLGGNNGNSINFDGAALQSKEEDEYRKEEEQQQNELRALLTNAFDDLIDEDDILSITSEEGTDSRNVSLVRRPSSDSLNKLNTEENKIHEVPENDRDFSIPSASSTQVGFQFPPHQQPRFGQYEPLSRTQEFPKGQLDILRASVESLPNFPLSSNRLDSDRHGSISNHGNRDQDSDYHSSMDEKQKVDFRGNVYPMEMPQGKGHGTNKVKGQGDGYHNMKNSNESDSSDRYSVKQNAERENLLRKSIEDFQQMQEAYEKQQQEHYYGNHGNQTGHNHYPSAEQPYDPNTVQGHHVHDQGQFFLGHDPGQVQHGYDPHYQHQHHHFRNIYENRPYHTIGEREETEGGNVQGAGKKQYHQMHHGYSVPDHHGYYHNAMATQGQDTEVTYGRDYPAAYNTTDHGFYSHTTGMSETRSVPNQTGGHRRLLPEPKRDNNGSHPKGTQKDNSRSNPNQNAKDSNRDKGLPQTHSRKEIKDNYKVNYKKQKEEKRENQEEEKETTEQNLEKDFMEQGGENQQMAQIQILYKARGRKIEELTNELEVVKSESARDVRILKHQLSVSKGEREGASRSLESVQDLLQEAKLENAQLVGRVNASESQIEGLKKGKEELIKKLQTAESTIETLHQHLEDLGSSDTLTRARHDHEIVVSGLQKKYDTEIKHLQEQVEKLNEKLQEKDNEVAILQQKLSDALKQSEREQVSRAETINRLSQSLEESQKRCRNLLESTSNQDMSQMKMQLQQALASKSISDEICSSLQDEMQDLKEQVQMYESASGLGISVTGQHGQSHSGFTDQNDSMADLGIKKTLDYDTPQGTPTTIRTQSHSSNDVVASLKSELERCLINNRQKRAEVTELKEELKKVKKEMLEYKKRCEGAELQAQEHKKRISDLEFCLNPGDKMNAIENRLKKDIQNLKREKKILLEDVEDLQKRLEEVSNSEEKLTELNRELSRQIADMVKEYDQDKREAIDRTQRACEQVSETSRDRLRQELMMQFDAERASVIAKYEEEVSKLSQELKAAQEEADKVKDVYVQLCSEKDNLQEQLEKDWSEKMEKNVQEVKQTMKKEEELALLRAEEEWAKDNETEVTKVKKELEQAHEQLNEVAKVKIDLDLAIEQLNGVTQLKNELEQALDRLKEETASEMKTAQEKFENELKTIKDIMEIEKSNEVEKMNKEKLNEIEKLKQLVSEKDKILDTVKTDKAGLVDMLKAELESKIIEINTLKKTIGEKQTEINSLKSEKDTSVRGLKSKLDEKVSEIEKLNKVISEKEREIEKLKGDIERIAGEKKASLDQKAREVENLKQEMELMLAKVESDRIKEVENLRTDIEAVYKEKDAVIEELRAEVEKIQKEKDEIERLQQDDAEKEEADNLRIEIVKNMQKEKQQELDQLRKEIIRLKLEIDRNESDKQLEIDKVCRVKQAEIENIEKRRQAELDRFKKEKKMEIDRLKKGRDDEINRLTKTRGERKDEEDITAKVREKLNKEMEEDLNRSLETKVAMSKVVWLEEHRATRQAAIDNAVRLAEAELRLKMEEELETKLEQRLEEAKILWQSDSMQQLEDERHNWDGLRDEELAQRLETEREKWRNTELQSEIEAERQKWAVELEQRLEEEKESWKEVELETEKLQWTLEWEKTLKEERDSWHRNIMEPNKRKWKMEAEERLRMEKDNWRCMELEPEKLNLLRECEERIAKEKQAWKNRDLPTELEKERKKWQSQAGELMRKEQERWRSQELPREIQKERERWMREMEERLRQEKNSWKNSELPEEIEKERKKWMKLMETTLVREKENWKTKDLPAEMERTKQELEKSMETEVEIKLLEKLEVEKEKLQKDSELKVLEAIEEHQQACKQELQDAIEKEKEQLKQQYDEELQERFQSEKKVWKEMVDQELNQKLEIEKEKWKRKSESDYNKKLETEKEKMKSWIRKDLEKRMEEDKEHMTEDFERQFKDLEKRMEEEKEYMREDFERQFKNKLNEELSRLRDKYDNEAREDFNHMKTKIEGEARQDFEQIKMQVEDEMRMSLEKEKELMQHRADREFTERIESEKEKWKRDFEKELSQKVHAEEEKWKQMIEDDIEKRLKEEKEKWEGKKGSDWENRISEEKKKWQQAWEEQKLEEMKLLTEQFEDRMRSDMEAEVEKLRVQVEHEFHVRVEHEVDLAVQEARDDWLREYTMEMSINTTSAEASQGLLREEIENLKQRAESLQAELSHKEGAWLKEKEDLILKKDLDRRGALEKLQNQTESEYKQFITEHQETLDKALKASREQHTKDKVELEERYLSQIKLIQAREKALQSQLQESLQGTEEQSNTLAEFEKDRILWYEERERLLQDIADRDSLLGKADVHLSKEIDKLRTELQAAYQRRLETEVAGFKQKIESEFNRANNSEHKEKLQLEKQLSEVNTELNKMRTQHGEEKNKLIEELKKLNDKMNTHEKKIEEYNRMEGELKKAKELLKGYKDELMEMQEKCQKCKKEAEDLQNKLTKAVQNQEMLQAELKKMKDEKANLIESVQSIEASYRKDMALYKQRQEEANNRILKTEKILQDIKQKYRSELESLRKALEQENDVAMNAMKNKMIELQKKHVSIVEEIKKKHALEREQIMKGQQVMRGVTPQPNVTDVDEIDQAVKELRSQYLDTVHKIKGDVLRHITETNVRAAETVKQEMDRERVSTFNQIKEFYRQNVKQILETEIVGSNLETKLLAVEEALDNLSSNPSSRSGTPDDFIVDERHSKSRSLSNTRDSLNRDAGISPKSQRTVTFTQGTRDDRSKTPMSSKDTSYTSTKSDGKLDDPRSPKSRLGAKSPREAMITIRGEKNDGPNLRTTRDWVYQDGKDSSFDTRLQENRPVSAKTHRELRDVDSRQNDRPLSAKSPRDLHIALREKSGRLENKDDYVDRERNSSGDKKKSRMLISTKDIHSGRYSRPADEEVTMARSKSVTSVFANHSSLYRPTSVPDLSSEDKELKVWTETNNDSYRYTPLRETLKTGTNLHRSNSKSESDLSIAEKNFGQLKPDYDSNLDLSTGSLTSIDSFFTPRKLRDAGETPTSTPRRHVSRKHYTMHSFPTSEQLTKELMSQNQSFSKSNDVNVSSPLSLRSQSSRERKNLPLIQFRHGKMQMQGLQRVGVGNSKSPHPDEPVLQRDTPPTRDTSNTPDRSYRPLSVSSNLRLDF